MIPTTSTTTTATTTTASTITNSRPPTTYPKCINVSNVTWVGGDMMSLYKTVPVTQSGRNQSNTTTTAKATTKTKTTTVPMISPSPTTTAATKSDPNDDIPPTMSVLRMQTTTLYTGSERVSSYVQRYFSSNLHYMMDSYNNHHSPNGLPHRDGADDDDHSNVLPISLTKDNYQQVIELLMPDVAIVIGTMNLITSEQYGYRKEFFQHEATFTMYHS